MKITYLGPLRIQVDREPVPEDWAVIPEEIIEDVLNALMNLGCSRPSAVAAIRQVRATDRNANQFEPLFRRALELVR